MDDSISKSEISGGKYLIYEVNKKHTAENIQKAYTEIFPTLLKQ